MVGICREGERQLQRSVRIELPMLTLLCALFEGREEQPLADDEERIRGRGRDERVAFSLRVHLAVVRMRVDLHRVE